MTLRFVKVLSANDVGATGAHMAGIAIPKGDQGLINFLPELDSSIKNPSVLIEADTDSGEVISLRYVYYNNKIHDHAGTRNEYRFTHLTGFLRQANACEGDTFEISRPDPAGRYRIRVIPKAKALENPTENKPPVNDKGTVRIRLTSAWSQLN